MRYFLTTLLILLFSTSISAKPVTVDNCGSPLTFEAFPERMVVHDINMAKMAFALGLQDHIVGLSGITGWYKTSPEFDVLRGDIPELAPKYPTMENLISVRPDLFFAGWYYGMRPGGEVTPDTLADYGIKTLVLTESCIHLDKSRPAASLDLLYGDIMRLGIVFGKEKQAERLVDSWKDQIAHIRKTVVDMPIKRVFLYDSGKDKPLTAGKYAMPTAMIEVAGGVNAMADMETSWGSASWEAIAATDPEFLVLLDYSNGGGAQELLEFLKSHSVMKKTIAVRNGRFVALRYEELTPGPDNIRAIGKIAKAMHPEAF